MAHSPRCIHSDGDWICAGDCTNDQETKVEDLRRQLANLTEERGKMLLVIKRYREACEVYLAKMDKYKDALEYIAKYNPEFQPGHLSSVALQALECDPPDACKTHGRCWAHSEWEDVAMRENRVAVKWERMGNDKLHITITQKQAEGMGIVFCSCGHPPNNHFDHGKHSCAHCDCEKYTQTIQVYDVK